MPTAAVRRQPLGCHAKDAGITLFQSRFFQNKSRKLSSYVYVKRPCSQAAERCQVQHKNLLKCIGLYLWQAAALPPTWASGEYMTEQQNWHTELYKGLEIHVAALPHHNDEAKWDYTVRIVQPAMDATALSELTAGSGDDDDYQSQAAAVQAGFEKGYAMVDRLVG